MCCEEHSTEEAHRQRMVRASPTIDSLESPLGILSSPYEQLLNLSCLDPVEFIAEYPNVKSNKFVNCSNESSWLFPGKKQELLQTSNEPYQKES